MEFIQVRDIVIKSLMALTTGSVKLNNETRMSKIIEQIANGEASNFFLSEYLGDPCEENKTAFDEANKNIVAFMIISDLTEKIKIDLFKKGIGSSDLFGFSFERFVQRVHECCAG